MSTAVSAAQPGTAVTPSDAFIDRRKSDAPHEALMRERRQFANSHRELSPEAAELAHAIDQYKVRHRRRFITFEEMLSVIRTLGYRRESGDWTAGYGEYEGENTGNAAQSVPGWGRGYEH
jgi:hypothetical protein